MNLNMRKLFDSLRDGLVIVSPDGLVRYANHVASQGLAPVVGKPLPSDAIRHQIRAAWQGYVKLPLTLEVDAPGQSRDADRLRVTLMHSPVGEEYVVVVHNITESQFYENTINNLAEVMRQELSQPFQGMVRGLEVLLEKLGNEDVYADPALLRELGDRVAEDGAALLRHMNQLLLMAETFSRAPMVGNDRILVRDLVSEVLLAAKPLLARKRIRVSMLGVNEELPTLYGSRRWLAQAMGEYIQYMAGQAKEDSEFLLTAKGGGNFIIFHLRNTGQGLPVHLRDRAFLPFHRGAGAPDGAGLGLGLALCKRVLELHKGHVRLVESEGETNELIMELPAGGALEAEEAAGIEQAQRYAQDIARLMQRTSMAIN